MEYSAVCCVVFTNLIDNNSFFVKSLASFFPYRSQWTAKNTLMSFMCRYLEVLGQSRVVRLTHRCCKGWKSSPLQYQLLPGRGNHVQLCILQLHTILHYVKHDSALRSRWLTLDEYLSFFQWKRKLGIRRLKRIPQTIPSLVSCILHGILRFFRPLAKL